jgi:hypothetical protein
MPDYIALQTTWLSHECREVKEGERFTTVFPDVNGKPVKLGSNIELAKGKSKASETVEPDVSLDEQQV